MSVYKPKKSRFYAYDFIWNGDRFFGSTGCEDREDAKAVEAAIRTRAVKAEFHDVKEELILDIAAGKYFLEVAQGQSSEKTTDGQLATLLRIIGKTARLSAINDGAVAEFVARRRAEPNAKHKDRKNAPRVSAATVNRETELLRRVMYRARDVWAVNVAAVKWKAHKLKETPPRDPCLSSALEAKLLAECADHLRPAVRFSLLTGLRLSNVINLDWSQIDTGGRTMSFLVKGGKMHRLPITEAVLVLLANQGPRETGPVFTRKGRKMKSWRTAWEAAKRRAEIENFRWHDLRHTAASRMVSAGVDISVVQDVLGHESIETTRRYVHHQDGAKMAALEALSGVQSRTIPGPDNAKSAIELKEKRNS